MHVGLSYNSVCLSILTKVFPHPCVCLLLPSGTLQLRYNLGGLQEPFTIDLDQRNLANGQPHSVNLTRTGRDIHVQVRENVCKYVVSVCKYVSIFTYVNMIIFINFMNTLNFMNIIFCFHDKKPKCSCKFLH